jgi:hypothetical protein
LTVAAAGATEGGAVVAGAAAGAGAAVVVGAVVAGAVVVAGALRAVAVLNSFAATGGAGATGATGIERTGAGEPGNTSSDSACEVHAVCARTAFAIGVAAGKVSMLMAVGWSSPAGVTKGTLVARIGWTSGSSVRTTESLCWHPMMTKRVSGAKRLRRDVKSVLVGA